MPQQMPWSLLLGGLFVLLLGAVGLALVVGLVMAWRRSLDRQKSQPRKPKVSSPDAWQTAGQRLWAEAIDNDVLSDRLDAPLPGEANANEETDHLGMTPPDEMSDDDEDDDDEDDLPWKKTD